MAEPTGTVSRSPHRSRAFAEFTTVALRRQVQYNGVTFPAGSRGVVVHRYKDGIGYEVEFSQPVEMVVTLTGSDLH
jgi:hypothetical protein